MVISDLLMPLIRIPWQVLALHQNYWLFRSDYANVMCKLNKLSTSLSVLVSIQSLLLVAVERFGAVVFPLSPPFITTRKCMFLIFSTWFVASAIASPYVFAQIHDKHGGKFVVLNGKKYLESHRHRKTTIFTSFDTCLYPNFSLDYTIPGHPHQAEVAEYSWQSLHYKCRQAKQNKK